MANNDDDLDQYRHPWDCDEHWEIRREFLQYYKDDFALNRLLCLAQVYTNIKLLGCSYPSAVMKQINQLAEDLPKHDHPRKKNAQGIKFVEGKEAETSQFNFENVDTINDKTNKRTRDDLSSDLSVRSISKLEPPIKKNKPKTNVTVASKVVEIVNLDDSGVSDASDGNSNFCEIVTERSICEPSQSVHVNKLRALFESCGLNSEKVKAMKFKADDFQLGPGNIVAFHVNTELKKSNLSPVWNYVMTNCKPNAQEYTCEMKFNDVALCQGTDTSKKKARDLACLNFFKKVEMLQNSLKSQNRDILELDRHNEQDTNHNANDIETTLTNAQQIPQHLSAKVPYRSFTDFVIFEEADNREPMSVLRRSSDMNKKVLTFSFEDSGPASFRCGVMLNQQLLACGCDSTKANAKVKAVIEALSTLQQNCYTVKAKARFVFDQEITKCNLKGPAGADVQFEQLPADNIGRKLLKQMGWAGGGLGKEEDGISEPIAIKPAKGRMGLGNANSKNYPNLLRNKIRELLRDYVRSGCLKDLVFTPEFTQEDRKILHEVAYRFGLRNVSYGKGDERYLVISRKWNLQELVRSLIVSGGSSEKYQLHSPGNGDKWQ